MFIKQSSARSDTMSLFGVWKIRLLSACKTEVFLSMVGKSTRPGLINQRKAPPASVPTEILSLPHADSSPDAHTHKAYMHPRRATKPKKSS